MEKIKKLQAVWLSVFIASGAIGVFSIVGTFIFASKLLYVPLGICIALIAHAAYGCPFYFIIWRNLIIAAKIELAIGEMGLSDAEAAEQVGLKPELYEKIKSKYVLRAKKAPDSENNSDKTE